MICEYVSRFNTGNELVQIGRNLPPPFKKFVRLGEISHNFSDNPAQILEVGGHDMSVVEVVENTFTTTLNPP